MRSIKFIALLTIIATVVLPITAVVVEDETVTNILKKIPVESGKANAILVGKKILASTVINYFDDTLLSLELGLKELSEDTLSKLELTYKGLFNSLLSREPSKKVVIYFGNESKKKTKSRYGKISTQPPLMPLIQKPKLDNTKTSIINAGQKDKNTEKTHVQEVKEQAFIKSKVSKNKKITKEMRKAKKLNIRINSAKEDHKRGLRYYKVKNFKKASKWFLQAAKKGYASAQYNLGVMSYLGQGMQQNYTQAANWFEKAGNQDHASAQYNLGYIYYEGKGVEKDNLQAYMWIDRSANLGDKKAIRARDSMQIVLPKDIFN